MHLIELLDKIDKDLFVFINSKYAFPFMDAFMLLIRKAEVWIPLYVGMLIWMISRHKRFALVFFVCTIITFAITDFVSASILKPFFERPRPCFDEDLQSTMRSMIDCGGRFGFPSSHASNHFGLAGFWFGSIKWLTNRRWYWLWIWAAVICYAQVYVGKHYPFDVAVGALFGAATGCTMFHFFRQWNVWRNSLMINKFRRTNNNADQSLPVTS